MIHMPVEYIKKKKRQQQKFKTNHCMLIAKINVDSINNLLMHFTRGRCPLVRDISTKRLVEKEEQSNKSNNVNIKLSVFKNPTMSNIKLATFTCRSIVVYTWYKINVYLLATFTCRPTVVSTDQPKKQFERRKKWRMKNYQTTSTCRSTDQNKIKTNNWRKLKQKQTKTVNVNQRMNWLNR